jgi:uncharacterized membrane protein
MNKGDRVIEAGGGVILELSQCLDVQAPVDQVYAFWRNFPHFQDMLENVQSIRKIDETRSAWVLRGPMDSVVRFQSFITALEPNRLVAWESEDGDIPHQGRVELTPSEDGKNTHLRLWIHLTPPGGELGEKIVRLGEMLQRDYVFEALYKIKRAIERQWASERQKAGKK